MMGIMVNLDGSFSAPDCDEPDSFFLNPFSSDTTLLGATLLCATQGDTGCGKTTQVPQFILEDAIFNGRSHVESTFDGMGPLKVRLNQ
jgi:hypothetical protein